MPDRAASLAFSADMAGVVQATGAQAFASLPLHTSAGTIDVLTVAWPQAQEFGPFDVELITASAAQCSLALDRIQVRSAERAALAALADTVAALQRSLLVVPAQLDHLEAAVRYLPAGHQAQVGVDWYDSFVQPDGRTMLVVGDVTGHDSSAAAAMAQVRNLLRGVAHHSNGTPAQVLTGLDRAMRDLHVGTLATAVVAGIEQTARDAAAGRRMLRWSNAGHPAPILLHADGTVELLDRPPEVLLGADPERARTDHTTWLDPGDTVVLYTDGLTERRGVPLDEGTDWLVQTLASAGPSTVEQLCDHVLADLTPDADDDIALLVIRAHPQPGSAAGQ